MSLVGHWLLNNGSGKDSALGNNGSLSSPVILNACDETTNFINVEGATFSLNTTTVRQSRSVNIYRPTYNIGDDNLGFDITFTEQDLTGKFLNVYIYIKDQATLDKITKITFSF